MTSITHRGFFGTGEHDFTLTDRMVEELERITGDSIGEVFTRASRFSLKSLDQVEVIRLDLIGGGMAPETAMRLVETYARNRPLIEVMALALETLTARWVGNDPAPVADEPAVAA